MLGVRDPRRTPTLHRRLELAERKATTSDDGSILFGRTRQREAELAADAWLALCPNASPVRLDDGFGNRESKPESLPPLSRSLPVLLENVRHLVARDAATL